LCYCRQTHTQQTLLTGTPNGLSQLGIHTHKNHYTTGSALSNPATHATMVITDPSNYIPKLEANGSNFWKWDAAVLMYVALNDASSILEGKPKPSTLLYTGWIPASEPVDGPTIDIDGTEQMHNLTHCADFDKSRAIINEAIDKAATKQDEKIRFWTKADTALKMTFLQTLSHEVYGAVAGLPTAAGQYAEISHRYKKDGLNKACLGWAEFFKLRCADCPNTIKFMDRFCAALNKLKNLQLVLRQKGILYQLIPAIEYSYPKYARTISRNLCCDRQPTLHAAINELNDKACCNDPVKTAAFAAKKLTETATSTNTNCQKTGGDRGGRYGHGHGCGCRGNNSGS
jgi:hypothetical protein